MRDETRSHTRRLAWPATLLEILLNASLGLALWAQLSLAFLVPGQWDWGRLRLSFLYVGLGFLFATISGLIYLYGKRSRITTGELFRSPAVVIWLASSIGFSLIDLVSISARAH